MEKKKGLSPKTIELLQMNKEEREEYLNNAVEYARKEAGIETVTSVEKEIEESSDKLNMGHVLFDQKKKNFVEIKYARKGLDYIYHISLTRKILPSPKQIIWTIANAVSSIIPDTIQAIIKPPENVNFSGEVYTINCYTVIVKKIAKKPGSRKRMEDNLVSSLLDDLDKLLKGD